jgi:hypothetical protein
MNQSAKKQHHEKARKRHKHEVQAHAREAARRGRSSLPLWFLVGGIGVIAALVLLVSFR